MLRSTMYPGCSENYVGQTGDQYNRRFNQHRKSWVSAIPSQNRDDTALLDHYRDKHPEIYNSWVADPKEPLNGFDKAFEIMFLDKVGANLLEQEDLWQKRLNSSLNRCRIYLPAIME